MAAKVDKTGELKNVSSPANMPASGE